MNDLRELLKVGYRVTSRNGAKICISTEREENTMRGMREEDLKHRDVSDCDTMKIERPTSEDGEPVKWITVWEREEPKFCLRIKDAVVRKAIGGGFNYVVKGVGYFFGSDREECSCCQTRFTRSEIEQIPQALRDLCEEIKVTK